MLIKLLLAPMESRCTLINPLPQSSNELCTVALPADVNVNQCAFPRHILHARFYAITHKHTLMLSFNVFHMLSATLGTNNQFDLHHRCVSEV